jgi:hypothetical protein
MDILLYIGFASALAVTLTVLFCRHQIARQKTISFWTVCLSALSATVIDFVCVNGSDIFTSRFWNYIWDNTYWPPIAFFLFGVGIPLLICFLSAALVAVFYHSRRKAEKPVA